MPSSKSVTSERSLNLSMTKTPAAEPAAVRVAGDLRHHGPALSAGPGCAGQPVIAVAAVDLGRLPDGLARAAAHRRAGEQQDVVTATAADGAAPRAEGEAVRARAAVHRVEPGVGQQEHVLALTAIEPGRTGVGNLERWSPRRPRRSCGGRDHSRGNHRRRRR
ncbi:hypothetical protein FDP22_17710 [Paroceanicella profunda]|uniref:Uncharacterized protein n=1 Tax=Paroceanicella profunda TaxID=2579971 RepID=A0A5B8FIP2_9RHOB|nr:hypothetical protein [Paroceanicella profunda]QDL93457.1 hypothetical protein FDP22_17710 [Paroceanicella profunda]